jgi:hypothetical protein
MRFSAVDAPCGAAQHVLTLLRVSDHGDLGIEKLGQQIHSNKKLKEVSKVKG